MTITQSWIRPEVRRAFATASHVVFNRSSLSVLSTRDHGALSTQFAQRYESMCALPRRTRRALERAWKKPLAAIALLLTLGQGTALAATMNVDVNTPPELNADGKCSLVEAILNAQDDIALHRDCVAGSGTDTIVLPEKSQQRFRASSYQNPTIPPITSSIVVEGRDSTVFGGTVGFRVMSGGDLTLNDTTVSGFGIDNAGTLTLNRTTIKGEWYSAGVLNRSDATAFINNSLITENFEWGRGGGIHNAEGSTVILVNSTVSNNGATFAGGGIMNYGTVTLINSLVSENSVTYEGSGGGIYNRGTLTLIGTRVLDNYAYGNGGGILNAYTGTASLTDSTVAGNAASYTYGGSGSGSGGGIESVGSLTLTNSTVSGNTADLGGGISARGSSLTLVNTTISANAAKYYDGGGLLLGNAEVTLKRSLVSGNTAVRSGDEIEKDGGTLIANNFNLFGHDGNAGTVGFTPGPTDIVPIKPVSGILLPLVNNGGKTRTQTHALAIGSPALDAIPSGADCPAKDQRGAPRPRGKACDIGAFEGSAVMCGGVVTTHVGTPGHDVILGTPGPDVIAGLGSGDVIRGLDGDDMICGGKGNDRLVGGPGIDTLLGQAGDDVLLGQGNDDVLNGGIGTDQCDGGKNDTAGDFAAQCERVVNVP